MDVNIGRIYFENKDEYNKFLAYKNSAEIDRQIKEKLIGTETFDGIKIQKAITEFVFDVEFALYSGMSSVKIEELVEILKTEPERFKKCSCYKKDKVCEIWVNSKTGVLEGFYSLIPDNRKAVVRHWRKEYLKKHIKNLDDIIIEKTANDFFHEITSRIQNEGMEWGRYKRNYFGSTIYNEYRKVFKNTLEYEKDAREYTDQWNDYYIYSMEVLIKEDKWLRAINEMQLYTFDELVDEKMEIKGLSREDAIWELNQRGPKELL